MGKALGIDYGTKRTGIAITDPEKIIAFGLTTVATSLIYDFIANLFLKDDIDFFVVGYPINLDGKVTDNTLHVKNFITNLKKKYPKISIHNVDERLTSKIAKKAILASGVKKTKRRNKALVDEVSATIILQNFLDYRA